MQERLVTRIRTFPAGQLYVEPAADACPRQEPQRERRQGQLCDRAGTETQLQPGAVDDDRQHSENGGRAHCPDDRDGHAISAHPADHLPPHRGATKRHGFMMAGRTAGREARRPSLARGELADELWTRIRTATRTMSGSESKVRGESTK